MISYYLCYDEDISEEIYSDDLSFHIKKKEGKKTHKNRGVSFWSATVKYSSALKIEKHHRVTFNYMTSVLLL